MKTTIVTGALLLALAGRASAQPGMTEPGLDPPPPPPAQAPAGEPLSERTALWLSVGGTIGAWSLLLMAPSIDAGGAEALVLTAGAISVVAAPSFGHWYADKYLTRGLWLRAGGGALMIAGIFASLIEAPGSFDFHDPDPGSEPEDGTPVIGPIMALAGAGMFVWGTVEDIATASDRVRQKNSELAGIAIAPVVTQQSAGFVLGGRF